MPVITVQLGQCGNQLGGAFFQSLATEFQTGEYGNFGAEEWFRPLSDAAGNKQEARSGVSHVARAVLVDMEPKVVNAVRTHAAAHGGWWAYPRKGFLTMQSGAGNNWAHGFHGYGPRVHDAAMELVRREAEACDVMGGFMVLQSMAGGTGAGLGAYVAGALRDEFPTAPVLNACVWPYDSGEVIVQSYNTLLTAAHLAEVSDGVIRLENEVLHSLCTRAHNIARPSFHDMNAVAARALTAVMLPARHRPASPAAPAAATHTTPTSAALAAKAAARGRGGWSPVAQPPSCSPSVMGGCAATSGSGVRMMSDLVHHVCAHPMYRMLSLRALPQVPAASIDFTTFTWPAICRRLKQMIINGSALEEGLDWGLSTSAPTPTAPTHQSPPNRVGAGAQGHTQGLAGAVAGAGGTEGLAAMARGGRGVNKSVACYAVLRGQGSADADIGAALSDPGLYPYWGVDPLAVGCHPARFARCAMSAAALSNDQGCVGPMTRMLDHAYNMLSSRAYVHQYEQYGLTPDDFNACFAHVEEIVERYRLL